MLSDVSLVLLVFRLQQELRDPCVEESEILLALSMEIFISRLAASLPTPPSIPSLSSSPSIAFMAVGMSGVLIVWVSVLMGGGVVTSLSILLRSYRESYSVMMLSPSGSRRGFVWT